MRPCVSSATVRASRTFNKRISPQCGLSISISWNLTCKMRRTHPARGPWTDTTVASGSASDKPCTACDTLASASGGQCCFNVDAQFLYQCSHPAAEECCPTPPPNFWRATTLPILMTSNTSSEMSALTTSKSTFYNKSLSLSLRNNTRTCSAVILDGPPAAPFLAVRKDTKNQSRFKAGSTSGLCSRTSRGTRNLGRCGLRLSSYGARKMMLSPSAHGALSSALSEMGESLSPSHSLDN